MCVYVAHTKNTFILPITFIIVNQDAKIVVHIIRLLYDPTASVVDPIKYKGNTHSIIGLGDVNVKIQDPAIVNITDTSSNQKAVLSVL
tara:strand:+ start:342 stop:605 length:264 start_codon:yes stop_codon:yes gene_type:complete